MKKKPEILLVYPVENDPQSEIMYEEILNKGGNPVMLPFKLVDGKEETKLSIRKDHLKINGKTHNIKAVFLRGVSVDTPVSIPPYLSYFEAKVWEAKFIKENDRIYFIDSMLKYLENNNALVVNPVSKYLHHNTKTAMFYFLRQHGISVPATFSTNYSVFLNKKLKITNYVVKAGTGIGATRKLNKNTKVNSRELIKTPGLFQEEIKGSTIRIHTVGEKVVLALKIIAGGLDSRTDTKGFTAVELQEQHKNEIIRANKLVGIHFSAWDAIIDEDDKIYLLDCNPGPYIFWIGEHFTRLVLAEAAKFLIAYTQNNSLEEAYEAVSEIKPEFGSVNKIDDDISNHIDYIAYKLKQNSRLRF